MTIVRSRTFLHLHIINPDAANVGLRHFEALQQFSALSAIPLHIVTAAQFSRDGAGSILHRNFSHISRHERAELTISGMYLESEITACALEALAMGIEVFLLADCVLPRSQKNELIARERLVQAGVVPSTIFQYAYLWQQANPEPGVRDFLAKFSEEQLLEA